MTVLAIHSSVLGDDIFCFHHYVVHVSVQIELGGMQVVVEVTGCTISGICLQEIDTVLHAGKGLVHVKGAVPCFSGRHYAFHCGRSHAALVCSFPTFELVIQVGVGQQVGHFRSCHIVGCNSLLQQVFHICLLGCNLLVCQHMAGHDIKEATVCKIFSGLNFIIQIRSQHIIQLS